MLMIILVVYTLVKIGSKVSGVVMLVLVFLLLASGLNMLDSTIIIGGYNSTITERVARELLRLDKNRVRELNPCSLGLATRFVWLWR
jgi:hypothetical protein